MTGRIRFFGLLLLLCAFVCGCQPARNPAGELAGESARRSQEVRLNYRNGDYQTAKAALTSYLQFLEKASSTAKAPDMYRTDAMWTCVRLAKLEEKEGHSTDQTVYMKQALAWCEKARSSRTAMMRA